MQEVIYGYMDKLAQCEKILLSERQCLTKSKKCIAEYKGMLFERERKLAKQGEITNTLTKALANMEEHKGALLAKIRVLQKPQTSLCRARRDKCEIGTQTDEYVDKVILKYEDEIKQLKMRQSTTPVDFRLSTPSQSYRYYSNTVDDYCV